MDMEKTNVEERATLKVAKPNKDEETLGLNVVSAKLSPVPEHPNREDNIDSSSKETDSKSAPSVLVTNFETGEILVEGREHSNLSAQRSDLVSNLGSSYDTSKRTGISESQMETSSNLKRRFEVSPGTASRIKPLREILADLDSDSDKNVVENTTEQSTFTDAATSMGFDYLKFSKDLQSRSQATTSEDIRPVHGVRISEDQAGTSVKENSSDIRYKRNLQKFLKYPESRIQSLSTFPINFTEHKTPFLSKNVKSDGAISYNLFHSISTTSSLSQEMETENISKSAPPSFIDDISSNEVINLHNKFSADEVKSNLEHYPQSLTSGDCNLQSLNPGPSKTEDVFKVPVLPKISEKTSKPQLSLKLELSNPVTSKLAAELKKSSVDGPRRPADFNISPRRSIYTFCPGSSSILRQCHSLPNISQPPKKDSRRSSVNFDNQKLNKSVKALFTGEPKEEPTTPKSSVSLVRVDDIAKHFKTESETGKQTTLDSKYFSENISNLSNKSKIRKKLIFVSQCENTNKIQTLQESSISSLDVSHGISSISLSDSVDSGHKIPLVESPPPKRKITSPDFSEDPDIPSKMVRISLEIEEISSKSTHVISKELHRKRAHSVIEEKDFLKYSPDINASAKVDTDAASAYSGSETTDKDPIIEFPADSEDSSKSERSSLKRTYVMPPDSVEDITDISLDVKRKKETE